MSAHSEYLFGAPPPSAPPAPAPQQYAPSTPFVSGPQQYAPGPQQYVMVPVPAAPAASFPEPAPQMEQHQHHYHPSKPPCRYGIKCYRKNPEHFKKYSHPPGVMRRNQLPPPPPPPPPPRRKHKGLRKIGKVLGGALKIAPFFF